MLLTTAIVSWAAHHEMGIIYGGGLTYEVDKLLGPDLARLDVLGEHKALRSHVRSRSRVKRNSSTAIR